eukprot:31379-Pelagococcus_subviridis.AAC.26
MNSTPTFACIERTSRQQRHDVVRLPVLAVAVPLARPRRLKLSPHVVHEVFVAEHLSVRVEPLVHLRLGRVERLGRHRVQVDVLREAAAAGDAAAGAGGRPRRRVRRRRAGGGGC